MATAVIEPRYQKPIATLSGPDLYAETEIRLKIPARRATDDCRSLANSLAEFLEENQWQRLETSWEAFCAQWIGKPGDWVLAMMRGVEVLDKSHPIPAKVAVAAGVADAREHPWRTHVDAAAQQPHDALGRFQSLPTVSRQSTNGKKHDRSNTYRLRRMARDTPEILTAYERGEYPSVRAAAKAAGIVKDKTRVEQLCRLWQKATPAERAQFLQHIQETRP